VPLGVVVPMANESATIHEFLPRVLRRLPGNSRVFCVFDHACIDGTREMVAQIGEHDPRVASIWAPENRSVVDAYFRGYREALADGCDWILEMDAGMSHDPDEIPRFLQAMSQGVDFAAGSRFVSGGKYRGPWSRYLISRGGTALANLMLGTRMKDMTSGFECFTSSTLEDVVAHGVRSRGHFFQTEIRFLLRNRKWVEVPITYSNPSKSVGSASIREAFRNLCRLRREQRAPVRRS
jgi:dolichol-phosphate mannosyltransferase